MPEGIRIRHHTRRNEILPVPLLHKPFPDVTVVPVCGVCQRFFGRSTKHPCKTLHLTLDDAGSVIVSQEIWADLQLTANRGGFTLANPVLKPPTQIMRPPTVKQPVDGIELGGSLAAHKRAQVFTPAGTTRTDYTPPSREVSLDEYLDVTGELGVTPAQALNTLLAALLGLTKKRDN